MNRFQQREIPSLVSLRLANRTWLFAGKGVRRCGVGVSDLRRHLLVIATGVAVDPERLSWRAATGREQRQNHKDAESATADREMPHELENLSERGDWVRSQSMRAKANASRHRRVTD